MNSGQIFKNEQKIVGHCSYHPDAHHFLVFLGTTPFDGSFSLKP
jgi:hypothetical protein